MNNNPILDLAEQVKQKKLDNDIKSIKDDIEMLKRGGNFMVKLIEIEIFQMAGSVRNITKASINPEQIVAIKEDGDHANIYMVNDYILQTTLTREEVVNLIEGHYTPPKSYVG